MQFVCRSSRAALRADKCCIFAHPTVHTSPTASSEFHVRLVVARRDVGPVPMERILAATARTISILKHKVLRYLRRPVPKVRGSKWAVPLLVELVRHGLRGLHRVEVPVLPVLLEEGGSATGKGIRGLAQHGELHSLSSSAQSPRGSQIVQFPWGQARWLQTTRLFGKHFTPNVWQLPDQRTRSGDNAHRP
jgi:hypothetical protein